MGSRRGRRLLPRADAGVLIVVVIFLTALARSTTAADSAGRPTMGRAMTPQDLLGIQSIDDLALSPDGAWVAVTVVRPRHPGEFYRVMLDTVQRADVWIAPVHGGDAINLTRGDRDAAGYWSPVWSPDGEFLAMLSTQGGDNVRLFVWERATRELRRLTEDGIDLEAMFHMPGTATPSLIAWQNSQRLLAIVLPPGRTPVRFREIEGTGEIETRAAADVLRGRGSTAVVWSSGNSVTAAAKPLPVASLVSIDVRSAQQHRIADLPLTETRVAHRIVSVAPDGKLAALVLAGEPRPVSATTVLRLEHFAPFRLGVVALDGPGEVQWVSQVRPLTLDLGNARDALRWGPRDDGVFALIGVSPGGDAARPGAFVIDARAASVRDVIDSRDSSGQALVFSDVQWTEDGRLLLAGAPRSGDDSAIVSNDPVNRRYDRIPGGSPRRDWWLADVDGQLRNLTARLPTPPSQLQALSKSGDLIAWSAGRLWRIDTESGAVAAIVGPDSLDVTDIAWPEVTRAPLQPSNDVVVRATRAADPTAPSSLYEVRIDDPRRAWRRVIANLPGASRVRFSRAAEVVACATRDTRVYAATSRRSNPIELLSLNRKLDAIERPRHLPMEYRIADGQTLDASLLLPRGYVPGRRYPLVADVYGGHNVQTGELATQDERYFDYYLNPLLLAARGYLVLEPSIPLAPMGAVSDPLLDLEIGVEPALAKAIEMGIADANRIAVIGVSYGGYTTAGLIGRSTRYCAAVSLAGAYNLVSYYGKVDRRYLYRPDPFAARTGPYGSESQQMRMGIPVWKDIEQYWRNSPLAYVERIQTPLLLVHGTVDNLPVSQAEELFVSLNRLGKRVDFVRYVGEEHGLESPGNILDMWSRMHAWFDEFCDITRDANGDLVFAGERVKSRRDTGR